MPSVVKTIKPLGGGDYTNLQDWWNWAKTQTNAAQKAECYGGSSLGPLDTTGGASFTADATDYPEVYAVDGYLGGMTFDTAKPHIDDLVDEFAITLDSQPYFRVNGLQIRTVGFCGIFVNACGFVRLDANLILSAAGTGIGVYCTGSGIGANYVSNTLTYDWGRTGIECAGNNLTIIDDCGVVNCGNSGAPTNAGIRTNTGGGGATVTNTYVLNTGAGPCIKDDAGISMSKVFTSDATGTNTGISTSGQVTSLTSDWTTLETSDFFEAGDDNLADVPLDAMGHTRTLPVWVGPYQYTAPTFNPAIVASSTVLSGGR